MEAVPPDVLANFALAGFGILLGAISAYVAFKYRQKGRLKLVLVRKIGLFNELTSRIPSLNIAYNDEPVSDKLTYIEGAIANVGNIDITKNKLFGHVSLSTTHGKFINLSKAAKDSPLAPRWTTVLQGNEVMIEFDLLKKGEFLPFVALAEMPDTNINEIKCKNRRGLQ